MSAYQRHGWRYQLSMPVLCDAPYLAHSIIYDDDNVLI